MNDPRIDALLDVGRMARFASVGIIGMTLDLSISGVLVMLTTVPPVAVKLVGAECAILLMFVINDRWTFSRHRTTGLAEGLRRLVKSNLVRTGGITVQLTVVFILTGVAFSVPIAGVNTWPVWTMVIAIVCGSVLNYIGETILTWSAWRE